MNTKSSKKNTVQEEIPNTSQIISTEHIESPIELNNYSSPLYNDISTRLALTKRKSTAKKEYLHC
jgi:hypothetical protein